MEVFLRVRLRKDVYRKQEAGTSSPQRDPTPFAGLEGTCSEALGPDTGS